MTEQTTTKVPLERRSYSWVDVELARSCSTAEEFIEKFRASAKEGTINRSVKGLRAFYNRRDTYKSKNGKARVKAVFKKTPTMSTSEKSVTVKKISTDAMARLKAEVALAAKCTDADDFIKKYHEAHPDTTLKVTSLASKFSMRNINAKRIAKYEKLVLEQKEAARIKEVETAKQKLAAAIPKQMTFSVAPEPTPDVETLLAGLKNQNAIIISQNTDSIKLKEEIIQQNKVIIRQNGEILAVLLDSSQTQRSSLELFARMENRINGNGNGTKPVPAA
jgi:hypothetical protein